MENQAPSFLPVRAFARAVSLDQCTVRRLIASGEIRATRIGRSVRIPVSELDRLARGHTHTSSTACPPSTAC
jgi:excisionase family DNA binding protein